MKCRVCEANLTKENTWKCFMDRVNPIYLCQSCDKRINNKWVKSHLEDKHTIQKNYFAKKMMGEIMSKKFKPERFNFLSKERLEFLFNNVLWNNDNLNLDKWSIAYE